VQDETSELSGHDSQLLNWWVVAWRARILTGQCEMQFVALRQCDALFPMALVFVSIRFAVPAAEAYAPPATHPQPPQFPTTIGEPGPVCGRWTEDDNTLPSGEVDNSRDLGSRLA
jgi:hypothetical protein